MGGYNSVDDYSTSHKAKDDTVVWLHTRIASQSTFSANSSKWLNLYGTRVWPPS